LFNNEERKIIGTLYKQKGSREAVNEGFILMARKLDALVDAGREQAKEGSLRLYCWRGGMRSASMAWLFRHYGIQCSLLEGGYKAYRRYVRKVLGSPFRYIVVGGMTGSGKTGILHALARKSEQILDLEACANHRGSAFGWLGKEAQPGNEHFENLLCEKMRLLDREKAVFIEDESRNIGRNLIPAELYARMQDSPVVVIDMPAGLREDRLVEDYGQASREELAVCITRISKRLGGLNTRRALDALAAGDLKTAASISLAYYDKTYRYDLQKKNATKLHYLPTQHPDAEINAEKVMVLCAEKGWC
jgi:tRNA 2-selenouridine synthase